jgi:hypothetical protein
MNAVFRGYLEQPLHVWGAAFPELVVGSLEERLKASRRGVDNLLQRPAARIAESVKGISRHEHAAANPYSKPLIAIEKLWPTFQDEPPFVFARMKVRRWPATGGCGIREHREPAAVMGTGDADADFVAIRVQEFPLSSPDDARVKRLAFDHATEASREVAEFKLDEVSCEVLRSTGSAGIVRAVQVEPLSRE